MNRLPEAIGELLQKENYTYGDLVEIVRYLRSENGCPWDRAQTHETLSVNLVEECYELVDAIALKSADKMREETGDVLLQAVFHAVLGEEAGEFTNGEMLNEICRKLITRHTNVFGNDGADGAEEALVNWDKNKYREKGHKSPAESVADVPKPFPALLRAQKVQKRAGKFGFDFESKEQVFGKIAEELDELKVAVLNGGEGETKEELGDLLFSVVNLARFLEVNAEEALAASTEKFIARFTRMCEEIAADGKEFSALSQGELDVYYDEAKKN